jgi:hypothetical protein
MKLGEGSAVVTVAVAAVIGILAVSKIAEMATYIVIGGVIYLGHRYYSRKIDKLQTQFSDYKLQVETSAKLNEAKSWLLNRENSR